MVTEDFIRVLRRIVGKSQVSVSPTDVELYSYDASTAKGKPGVVVFPGNATEAAEVVRVTHQAGIPFLPRGFGTNLSGGTILPFDGVVVCLSRLNRILEISPEKRRAVVQPGVTNLELQNALAPLGFFYAPDPASQKVSTLGGNVGENSGGPHCLKYGVTSNHVLGLQLILPTGEIIQTGSEAFDPPGYDLHGLMVGSEGTLGIVTEVIVQILPKPESVITMLAVYDDISDAARSVSAIISAGIVPTTLEMMDAVIIKAVEDSLSCGYPRDAAAVLIIEVEGLASDLKNQARHIDKLCMQNKCREIREARDDAERDRLWAGRRGAFGAIARLAPSFLVNDCTVPRTKLPEALDEVARIAAKYNFQHGNVFHAGDGNLHPLMLFDSRIPDQLHLAKKAGWEIMIACVKLGGTITGEHGVGLEKMDAMRMIFSEHDFEVQRAVQRALDPQNLLNPGKVIPEPKKPGQKQAGADFQTDGIFPGTHVAGKAEKEIITKIKDAVSQGQAFLAVGSGTHRHFGNLSARPTLPLESSGLTEMIDHDPDNQVVTVGAGMLLETLQKQLSDRNQWLPLRPPFALQKHSVGGMVALGACGPERMLYGAPRDFLLGLHFISGRGHFISTGGRVVKNVAGYDMTRLLAGSAGTLGFITDVTLRVATIPECCMAVSAHGPLDACAAVASEVIRSSLLPVLVVATPENPAPSGSAQREWTLQLGFEGLSKTVDGQIKAFRTLLEKGGLESTAPADYNVHDGMFREAYADLEQSVFIFRAAVPLDQVAVFATALDDLLEDANVWLDFGCGKILAGLRDLNDAAWVQLCSLSDRLGGYVLLEKAPDEFKKQHDVFGLTRPDWHIMHRIKTALDPQNIFAPGHLPGRV